MKGNSYVNQTSAQCSPPSPFQLPYIKWLFSSLRNDKWLVALLLAFNIFSLRPRILGLNHASFCSVSIPSYYAIHSCEFIFHQHAQNKPRPFLDLKMQKLMQLNPEQIATIFFFFFFLLFFFLSPNAVSVFVLHSLFWFSLHSEARFWCQWLVFLIGWTRTMSLLLCRGHKGPGTDSAPPWSILAPLGLFPRCCKSGEIPPIPGVRD